MEILIYLYLDIQKICLLLLFRNGKRYYNISIILFGNTSDVRHYIIYKFSKFNRHQQPSVVHWHSMAIQQRRGHTTQYCFSRNIEQNIRSPFKKESKLHKYVCPESRLRPQQYSNYPKKKITLYRQGSLRCSRSSFRVGLKLVDTLFVV